MNSRSSKHPYLEMIIEPENKFRYRYKSEAEKSSHGGILGKKSETDAIEERKGQKKIYPTVKLVNYNKKEPVSIRVSLYTKDRSEQHVLELKGGETGMYIQDLNANHIAVFKNLAIINKKQDEVFRILLERKIKRLGDCSDSVRAQLETQSRNEFKEWMNQNLDSVVLCFEAVYKNSDKPLCEKLFSDTVKNQKSSLRIMRLSRWYGSCAGDEEVILLCDKVKKNSVKVIFADDNDDDTSAWKAEGKFKPVDVHHQVAIVFKTPSYKENVERTVNLYLQQEDERSESVEFKYIPDSCSIRKRKRNNVDEAQVPLYQQNLQSMNAASPGSSSNGTSPDKYMYEIVPLPDEHIDGSNLFSYDLLQKFSEGEFLEGSSSSAEESGLATTLNIDPTLFDLTEQDLQGNESQYESPFEEDAFTAYMFDILNTDTTDSSRRMHVDALSNHSILPPQLPKSILLSKLHKLSLSSHSSNKSDEDYPASHSLQKNKDVEKISDRKDFNTLEEHNCNLGKSTRKNINVSNDLPEGVIEGQMAEVDSSTVEFMIVPPLNTPRKNSSKVKASENQLNSNFHNKFKVKCLQLLSMQDNLGNTLLHWAVLHNKNVSTVLKMNKYLLSSHAGIVNVQNIKKQTSILIATQKNNAQLVKLLLVNGADPNIKDDEGNNCYHIASKNNFVSCLKGLLCLPNLSGVDAFNYEGLTPLHIAIVKNSVECFYLLLRNAKTNTPDKNSGRTPLHYAVENSLFVCDLLDKFDTDVNFQDFSGNSPLHVACIFGNLDIISKLLEAGANPLLKNFKSSLAISEEEIFENETLDGQTPLDVSANVQVQELLKKYIEDCSTDLSDSDQSDCYIDATESPVHAIEEKISNILDDQLKRHDWEKIVMYVGMDERYIDTIFKCSSSPTRAILSSLKKNQENYIDVFHNALEMAGLTDVLKQVKEM